MTEYFLRNIYPWMVEVASFSCLIPFVAACIMAFKYKSPLFKLIFFYVILNVVLQSVGYIAVMLGSKNNLWSLHLSTVLEYAMLSIIFYKSFRRKWFKRGVVFFAISLTLFGIWNAFYGEGLTQMNTHARMAQASLLIVLIMFYFYKVSNDMSIIYLDRDPIFILCCFILINKAGSTMTYAMFKDALAVSYDAARMCLSVMLFLLIIYNTSLVLVLKRTPVK
jgi:hypothetical protein